MTCAGMGRVSGRRFRGGALKILCLVLPALVSCVPPARAWEYRLDTESRYFTADWCEDYVRNLNSFKAPPHMTCTRKISPKFPEFSEPKWEPLDALAHMDVLEAFVKQNMESSARNHWKEALGYDAKIRELYPKTPTVYEMKKAGIRPPTIDQMWLKSRKAAIDAEWAKYGKKRLEDLLARFRKKELWLGRARFDLDNCGEDETVYRMGGRGCYLRAPHNPKIERDDFAWSLFVLERDNANIEIATSTMFPSNAHVFFYEGRTYIDGWAGGAWRPPSSPMNLTVYEPGYAPSRLFPVCPIIYSPESKD